MPGTRSRERIILDPVPSKWLVNDSFLSPRAAGEIVNTVAEPGPGIRRTAPDTNGVMSIANSLLNFATGGVTNGNPGLFYENVPRLAGRLLYAKFTVSTSTIVVGFDSNNSGQINDCIRLGAGSSILTVRFGGTALTVGTFVPGTEYEALIALRAAGAEFFFKGGIYTYWTKIWSSVSSTGMIQPAIAVESATAVGNANLIIVPAFILWLSTPVISDGFGSAFGTTDGQGHAEGVNGGIGAGGGGLTWTHTTWSVAAGKAFNTPTLGSELLTDVGLEAWTTATNLTSWLESVTGSSTVNQETSVIHGGSNAARLDIDASANSATIRQAVVAVIGDWVMASGWMRSSIASGKQARIDLTNTNQSNGVTISLTDVYAQYFASGRATTTAPIPTFIRQTGSGSQSIYIDDASTKILTLATLFSRVNPSVADVLVAVKFSSMHNATQCGIVLNLDSSVTPANFVLAYINGSIAGLTKCVGGVYTDLISASGVFSANAELWVQKRGTEYRLYYNNAVIGTAQTISDAGIISNTLHGLFSTSSLNLFDDFIVHASGTNNEHSEIDRNLL